MGLFVGFVVVGIIVGKTVGEFDGSNEGTIDGFCVWNIVGGKVSSSVGGFVGVSDGFNVGKPVKISGDNVGFNEDVNVGSVDGLVEGWSDIVGIDVGIYVGIKEGSYDGSNVGNCDGIEIGNSVGKLVGWFVGVDVFGGDGNAYIQSNISKIAKKYVKINDWVISDAQYGNLQRFNLDF